MKATRLFLLLPFLFFLNGFSQKTIIFPSVDKLPLTADLYVDNDLDPYMILFHDANSSRGEYRETAPKMMKFGYNCMAVDLRSGGEENFIINESYQKAIDLKIPTNYLFALKDINASIDYAYNLNVIKKPVVLVGSAFTASLCIIAAKNNPKVKAVIAFSPGEYFGKDFVLKDSIVDFAKPLLVLGITEEYPYWKELFSKVKGTNLTLFVPEKKKGLHGSKALWKASDARIEYWIEMMMFIRKIK